MKDKGEPPDVINYGNVNYDFNNQSDTSYRTITTNKILYSPSHTITAIDSPNMQDEIKKIWERLNKTVTLVHNCANCGAKLEIEENHPVFHCKYCGSTYIIGATQPNSRY